MSHEEWARLRPCLPKNAGRGRRGKNHRQVINGILFRLRTGTPPRELLTRTSGAVRCWAVGRCGGRQAVAQMASTKCPTLSSGRCRARSASLIMPTNR
ncbi:transposase [Streptomyces platensis]|uniref:transposase n=1 Tax=Streptomyces platensis TaxID=58346 RepID=UPI003990DD04